MLILPHYSGNAHVIPQFNANFVSCPACTVIISPEVLVLQGIHDNNQWTLALSIFYVGYCLLEMPANGTYACRMIHILLSFMRLCIVLQRHIGANRLFVFHCHGVSVYIPDIHMVSFFMSLTFWGLSSLSMVYAKGYGGLLALR